MDQPLEAVLLGKLRVTPEGEAAEAVEQLTYIPGSATGCPNNLLVLGGQMLEMPPALTILPLECLSGNGGQQASSARVFVSLTCTTSSWMLCPLVCVSDAEEAVLSCNSLTNHVLHSVVSTCNQYLAEKTHPTCHISLIFAHQSMHQGYSCLHHTEETANPRSTSSR